MLNQEKQGNHEIPAFLQREKTKLADARIRPSDDFTFYGITKTRAGEAMMSLALKLILKNGEQIIIQYHEMISPMRYDGANKISIATTALAITIRGSNLESVFDYLAEYRLVWIKEPDSDFLVKNKKEGEIESIQIEDRN